MRRPPISAATSSPSRNGLSANSQGQFGGIGALGRLIRAVEVFGFHLATLDMRQNSAVHERVARRTAQGRIGRRCADYPALDEEARVALLTAELAKRPAACPRRGTSGATRPRANSRSSRPPPTCRARLGRDCDLPVDHHAWRRNCPTCWRSMSSRARRGCGGRRRCGRRRRESDGRAPVRDDRRPRARACDHGALFRDCPKSARRSSRRGHQEVMIGYSGFEQGRRLSDLDLGLASGIAGADPGVRGGRHRDAIVPWPRRRSRARRRQRLRRRSARSPRARCRGASASPNRAK